MPARRIRTPTTTRRRRIRRMMPIGGGPPAGLRSHGGGVATRLVRRARSRSAVATRSRCAIARICPDEPWGGPSRPTETHACCRCVLGGAVQRLRGAKDGLVSLEQLLAVEIGEVLDALSIGD